jgi:hypothetical protein
MCALAENLRCPAGLDDFRGARHRSFIAPKLLKIGYLDSLPSTVAGSGTSVLSAIESFLYPESYCRLAPPRINFAFDQEATL